MKSVIADHLLTIKAVSLSPEKPYTWSSGMQSPIYCDNRVTLGFPEVRNHIIEEFVHIITSNYPDADVIAGTATAGIPHASLIADRLGLPMCYVRGEAKAHGKGKQIEGYLQEGKKAVVIEDLISTGKSSIQAANALRANGVTVLGVAAIFTYELNRAAQEFKSENIDVQTLTDFSTLVEEASRKGSISSNDLKLLHAWKADPEGWMAASSR
ncbi:orotate phosphoribosyltransferase [Fictibacillus aquaticus]|uniref:Orotate phosphoribosyltransferase n=1 Tax=Fictibacillus aquaticus TaxID=2021314 RepID=A0A235FD31_9BACL|nr:orotate phosphoribosyltransferase [Fictibacillus aquaticus]